MSVIPPVSADWLILILTLVIGVMFHSRRGRYYIFQILPRGFLRIVRITYSYPSLIVFTVPIIIAIISIFYINLQAIVVVTIFYASVLFFGRIFQVDRPYPALSNPRKFYDNEYGDGDGEGFGYRFFIENQGEKSLLNPQIEYKIFDGGYKTVQTWETISNSGQTSISIAPGNQSDAMLIQGDLTDGSDAPDRILSIRVIPQRGNWVLAKWWSVKLGKQEASEP